MLVISMYVDCHLTLTVNSSITLPVFGMDGVVGGPVGSVRVMGDGVEVDGGLGGVIMLDVQIMLADNDSVNCQRYIATYGEQVIRLSLTQIFSCAIMLQAMTC